MPIDYKFYHPRWKEIRKDILERDNGCCKFCGVPNYSFVDKTTRDQKLPDEENVTRIVLTIAHLDHNRDNNGYENLAALCQKCHLNLDRHQREFNRKYGRETKRQNGKLF
jgi:5-methylcytosine-specific restriction endonuclease McrA